jgi:signal transduction histidine kinase
MESSQALLRLAFDTRPDVGSPTSSTTAAATANPAFAGLAQSLATAPRAILQKFADVALGLCEAHAVGDARLLDNLGKFVAAAYEVVASRDRRESELVGRRALDVLAASSGAGQHQLLAIFAHEVRSHLAPAKNACELLQRGVLDQATTKRMCAIIDRQIDAMSRIVGELLDDTRLRSGKVELHRREMALDEIIARSVELVTPLVAARKHALLVDVGADGLRVEADELWLPHALQNVIGNAAKYADPGGRIEVRVAREDEYAVISVYDTGVGLAPDQLETIFGLYTQAEQPPERAAAGGLGVGLYFARSVIEQHGGAIRATSEGLGRGSVFTIRLPCVPPPAARLPASE